MKKTIFSIILALGFMGSLSAQLKVGVAGSNPNGSAILELESTSKGFLPPRMTSTQRDDIKSPPAGLLIYNTTSNALEVCNGTNWVNLATEGTTARTTGSPSGNGGAGLGNASPVAQAKLQLSSTTKGFLPPRLTSIQRNAIASPPAGLLIYNTTDKRLEYANGTHWVNVLDGSNITAVNGGTKPSGTGDLGIGTTNPDVHASLEIASTTQGFLLPNMTTAQMESISSPSEGLMLYNTDVNLLVFYDGSSWASKIITTGACAGSPSTIFHDGYVYKPVVSNGKCWLNNNLGASYANPSHGSFDPNQQATTSADANAYGDLYQWGRAADGHEKRGSSTHDGTSIRPNTIAATGAWDGKFITIPDGTNRNDWVTTQTDNAWNAGTEVAPVKTATDPCPTGYRLPTEAEWDAERLNWSSKNAAGALASPLKLPMAGYRDRTVGSLSNVGSFGGYWSSTVSGANAGYLRFGSSYAFMVAVNRAYGFYVRCLKD